VRIGRRHALACAGGAVVWALAAPGGRTARAAATDPGLERFRALCLETARANVVDGRPIPSRAYSQGTWLRDAYWTLAALADRELQRHTWQRFAAAQNMDSGQVPTALTHSDAAFYAAEDESTALFVLLALDLERAGVPLDRAPLERASRYLQNRLDVDGRVPAGPGAGTWWLDTLILAQRDTVAYTQGVTAVGLRALTDLDVPVPSDLVERAEAAYGALYLPDLGTMTLSAGTTLLDVSCLVGEHLSRRLFGRALLTEEIVAGTLGTFRRVDFDDGAFLGFPVATQLDGSYMPEEWFAPAPDNWPGYYHNGGSWLLYDALALDVGRSHAVIGSDALLHARILAEVRLAEALHEYIATNPALGHLGHVPMPWRSGYAWNSYVATLL
jgi:hypothetical protein